uniref:acyltransferase family protein n=1 Tax=Alistipes sp. TaxID=1872444 RepID=UPI004056A59F
MNGNRQYDEGPELHLIASLRLPLMLLVLFNHARLLPLVLAKGGVGVADLPLFRSLYLLFTVHLSRLAVPLFFLFSGYLFFRGAETIDALGLLRKLKRRVRTLLIPYLLWNLLTLLVLAAGEWLLPSLLSGERTPIAAYTLGEFLSAFWSASSEGYSPICIPLWYLRDLMVVLLLTYPMGWLLRRWGFHLPLLLGALWLFLPYNYAPVVGLSWLGLLFFSLGGAFALRRRSFVALAKRYRLWALLLYVAGFLLFLLFRGALPKGVLSPLFNLMVLAGMISVVGFAPSPSSATAPRKDEGFTFFLYASHYFVVLLFMRLLVRLFHPTGDLILSGLYLLLPVGVALLLYALYRLLKGLMPRLIALLTGDRA